MFDLTVAVASEAEMQTLGARLGEVLRPGDTVLLDGPIASGKSVLARAALRELGVTEHVPSPTFALAFSYPLNDMVVIHADAYRLDGPMEYLDLALEETYEDPCMLIEWGSKIATATRGNYLEVVIEPTGGEGARTVRFVADEQTWGTRLTGLGVMS